MARSARAALDWRVGIIGLVLVASWIAVGYRLFTVHGAEAATFADIGDRQRVRHEVLDPIRGSIFDRNGGLLAVTVDAVTVWANPSHVVDPETSARFLAPLVNGDPAVLKERLESDRELVYVARKLDPDQADRVRAAEIPGVYFIKEPKRVYPAGDIAAQLLGFVRVSDNEALEGLELRYDDVLSGEPGRQLVERDPSGAPIPQAQLVIEPAKHGADLTLTIDREIQFAADRALAAAVEETGALGGSIVALEVASGEILAMANAPSYDPNRFSASDPETYRNRSVTDKFEPGSTLKLITVAGALEDAAVAPNEFFEVPQEIEIDDKTYEDVGNHDSRMSVADIVAFSSNVGTIMIQDRLGNDRHHHYLQAFGLGQAASHDFSGEAAGLLRPATEWCPSTCGPSTAIGYRVDVTALQMAAVYATVANDGVWIEPHVVREIVDANGARRLNSVAERPVLSAETARIMRQFLGGVVERGTGSRAAVDGYFVGGKTGTTEKFIPEEGRYSATQRIASFIGMAPLSDPQIVIAVILDSPTAGKDTSGQDLRFGGVSAAPVFADVMHAALQAMGVPPDAD